MTIADTLLASRAAHQQAKKALALGQADAAYARFGQALSLRLSAREADPDRRDPAWLEDARLPAIKRSAQPGYHRIPGLTVSQVAAQKDAELERYYRQHLGEIPLEVIDVPDPEIVTPKQWSAVVICPVECPCAGRHRWVATGHTRACADCRCQETLVETIPVERTEAYRAAKGNGEERQ